MMRRTPSGFSQSPTGQVVEIQWNDGRILIFENSRLRPPGSMRPLSKKQLAKPNVQFHIEGQQFFPLRSTCVAKSGYLKKFLAAMKSMAGIWMRSTELPTVAQLPVRLT